LSRKYSAKVTPERATRRREPGGSFIWPNTIAVLSMTCAFFPEASVKLASFISSQRSLPFAGALADAGEHRDAAGLDGDVADQLLHHDGLADAGAAEEADLAALREGAEQVDDLDARLEDARRGLLVDQRGRERWIG
jgi:hypothetical protein